MRPATLGAAMAVAILTVAFCLPTMSDQQQQQQQSGKRRGTRAFQGKGRQGKKGQRGRRGRRERIPEHWAIEKPAEPKTPAQVLVNRLELERFKSNIKTLSDFGDRTQGSESNIEAGNWIEEQLKSYGYEVKRYTGYYRGDPNEPRDSIYVTKIGTKYPDQMYIVSGHMDGRGGGGAANDDGSGTSLTMEAARVFAGDDVQTEYSIRFILWNNEETGGAGASSYVRDRRDLQGKEEPAGSGLYPEPKWLGIIQHDMMMFDHGMPPGPEQSPRADVDIEYQQTSTFPRESLRLASHLLGANAKYSLNYPAEVTSNMSSTDSNAFTSDCPSVSVRENQRLAEIGNGADPHWHKPTDLYETFSDKDFLLGFNALQMTTGAIAELAMATSPKPGEK